MELTESLGLSRYERRVLELVSDRDDRPTYSGDVLQQVRFSDTTAYRALRLLEARGAVTGLHLKLDMQVPYGDAGRVRNGARWTKAYVRTDHGRQLLASALEDHGGEAKRSPRPYIARDDDGLLDPDNPSAGAITFQIAMQACAITTLPELRALPAAQRRQFEDIWSAAMYARCAAEGHPINLTRIPGTHRQRPTTRDTEDEEDLME